MNELKIFKNSEFGDVRTSIVNNEPYFMLSDVCRVLEIKNSRDVKTRLSKYGVVTTDVIDSMGRNQQADFINESNLYKLVFQSRKPQAEKFSEWVTSDVLPAIRQHGMYATDNLLDNPDFLIKALQELKNEREEKRRLQLENEIKTQQINEMKPKADYTDLILKSKSLVTITQIAKDYGISGKRMNEILHDLKVQYKQSGQWFLYSKYQDKGYTHSETIKIPKADGSTDVKMNTKWTQKGRLFLYQLLKNKDIYPSIEC